MIKDKGFTLVEVMVAVLILAGGLLGLAALQSTGISNNQSAYNRSQATQLAYDIADRMRSNPIAIAKYIDGSPETCATADSPCTACTSVATTCTPAQLAQRDLFDWKQNVQLSLPNAIATISPPLPGRIYIVTISWDDTKSGAASRTFTMNFRL